MFNTFIIHNNQLHNFRMKNKIDQKNLFILFIFLFKLKKLIINYKLVDYLKELIKILDKNGN